MQEILEALVDPTRRRILRLASRRELTAGRIAGHFKITRPGVSKHIRVLKEAGLLRERRQGTRRIYQTDPAALGSLKAMLDDFWQEGLHEIKTAAEAGRKKANRSR